jgi:hypothetical protein
VRPILPPHAFVIDQPQIGFVDKRRGLQAVARTLQAHVVPRETPQLGIDDGRQFVQSALIPIRPGAKQHADIFMRRCCRKVGHEPAPMSAIDFANYSEIRSPFKQYGREC